MKKAKRYSIEWGEMGTQEVVDNETGKSFFGESGEVIDQLIDELNRLNKEIESFKSNDGGKKK